MRTNWLRATILTSSLLLAACTPEHSKSVGFLQWEVDPGYQWIDKDAFLKKAKWVAGLRHPGHPRLLSSDAEGSWIPMAGYQWGATGTEGASADYSGRTLDEDLAVHWQPGVTHPSLPHIFTLAQQGRWRPEKGYAFTRDGDLRVTWRPGTGDPDRPHYKAAAEEGRWELEPGYAESSFFFSTYAVWRAGLTHPVQPCLVSSDVEGMWQPVSGYHLERLGDGRFKIAGDVTETDWGGVAAGTFVALIGYALAKPQPDDSALGTNVGRPLAEHIGDAGVRGAMDSIGSTNGGSCADVILDDSWQQRN